MLNTHDVFCTTANFRNYPLEWESLTLHNIIGSVVASPTLESELYWLGRLEEFLYAI